MHVHILGICGTFMGGIAQIARLSGCTVTGCDRHVYPPMSDQLEAMDIEIYQDFEAGQLDIKPDLVIVGNVMSRGMPVVERILNEGIRYISGPQWLYENILCHKWVIAVSGTHGKTTTTGMLAWILQEAGLNPSFLIGGVAQNFGITARLSDSPFFVIEADEYDTAFFDKRSKFVHYHPRTLIVNNLEYDHADIFPDLASIQRQFHHLLRIVPGDGRIVMNGQDENIAQLIKQGCWSEQETFATAQADWTCQNIQNGGACFEVVHQQEPVSKVEWSLIGQHNIHNALAAIAAARHVGVTVEQSCSALHTFKGLKRRMELLGEVNGICVYDDFAHHPTAIETTLAGLRDKIGQGRILAVLEPRSNTMRMGVHNDRLLTSLCHADHSWVYLPDGFDLALNSSDNTVDINNNVDDIVRHVNQFVQPGDHIVIMSNGGFERMHDKLLASLREG